MAGKGSMKARPYTTADADAWATRRLAALAADADKARADLVESAKAGAAGFIDAMRWAEGAIVKAHVGQFAEGVLRPRRPEDQPRTLRERIEDVKATLTTDLLNGYGETLPMSSSPFMNAAALAKAEAIRRFVAEAGNLLGCYRDAEPRP